MSKNLANSACTTVLIDEFGLHRWYRRIWSATSIQLRVSSKGCVRKPAVDSRTHIPAWYDDHPLESSETSNSDTASIVRDSIQLIIQLA